MAVKDLFSRSNKYISRKNMRTSFRNDPTFQKIANDSRMKKIVHDPGSQKRMHALFLEKSRDGKVDVHDMTEIAHKLEDGKVSGISSAKGHLIAKEFLPNLKSDKPFIKPKKASQTKASTPSKAESQPASKKKSMSASRHSSLDFEFVKTGFTNSTSQATPVPLADNRPSDTKTQMAALMNIARKKILNEKNNESGDSKGSFSSAMAATMKNKQR
jgi:hypothetical protein